MKYISIKKFVALTLSSLVVSGNLSGYAMESNPNSKLQSTINSLSLDDYPRVPSEGNYFSEIEQLMLSYVEKHFLMSPIREEALSPHISNLITSFKSLSDILKESNGFIEESKEASLISLIQKIFDGILILEITDKDKKICNISQSEDPKVIYNQDEITSSSEFPTGTFYSAVLEFLKSLEIAITEKEEWSVQILTDQISMIIIYLENLSHSFSSTISNT